MVRRNTSSSLVLVGSSVQLKSNDRSSSNSSIENSKPTTKVGRSAISLIILYAVLCLASNTDLITPLMP